ncbi:MAG: RND family efflux transporter MFP subunit [Candidatus Jorgensenbacteria bacterium GW2011_GWA1_48_13]|uniref:RND family efflux transporter MFP subunit n=1 Tax=Candidatus Jorgensenbacteria bacterium GW2011_GWB1_50_10 TaxID=1618665 RepID=A0A0G1Z8S2_9BACT|nr:MAG: RND family efflux transporter MFP subunit [Candidatus Jorgensenbacteria bacterium GW2011_GWA1_48_13]KKW15434.1 MAG: RND family efflux transporter MFP subunit [Candidatus Jorgensenbacteria bacterium GW2011_GWB1_50_10]
MKILKSKKVIIGLIVVVLAVFVYFVSRDKGPQYEYAVAARGNILQEVSVTGRVKPAEDVTLAFETSGRVRSVSVKVGDTVFAGTVLVRLDAAELSAELAKAESDLATQRAKLDEAKTALGNVYTGAINDLNSAYLKADDAVHVKITSLFTSSGQSVYQLSFDTCDYEAKVNAGGERAAAEEDLKKWKSELALLNSDLSETESGEWLNAGRTHLNLVKGLLENLNKALNADCILNQSSLDTYRASLSTARSNVNDALVALSNKEQAILSQKAAVTSVEVSEKSYEASVSTIKTQLAKTVLVSPIRGTISSVEAEAGEIVGANAAVASVISAAELEIEANIPEVDVAKIKVGDEAKVTLDAYGSGVVFQAMVFQIDPAEKIIEGVPTYRTKLQFTEKDERIKSGMTANIDILAAEKENVIYVPARAVVGDDNRTFVRILEGNIPKEADVQTGLRGSDGNVEIISGLNDGDKVVTFEK